MALKKTRKYFVLSDATLFDLLLLCFFVLIGAVSFYYNPRARSIPLLLGIVGSAMVFAQLIFDAVPGAEKFCRFVGENGLLAGKKQFEQSLSPGRGGKRVLTQRKRNLRLR